MVVFLLHTESVTGSNPVITTKFRIVTAKINNTLLLKRKGTVRLRSRKVWCNGSTMLNLSCFIVGALCNGSTTDFESVSLGSIPSAPAKLYRVRIVENTQSYEVWNGGSIPSRDTNLWCH